MREAHAHISAFGQSLTIPSLASCRSVAECLDSVRRASERAAPGAWLRFHSARVESWAERRWPAIGELDRAAGESPCVLMSFDHHAAAANTAALCASGLRPGDVVTPEGEVRSSAEGPIGCGEVCTDGFGRATGLLLEHAAYRAWNMAPPPNAEGRRRGIALALKLLSELGFTEVHDLHSEPSLGHDLARLERRGELGVRRVRLYPPASESRDPALFRHLKSEWESNALRVAGFKVFADGTLNSRTAFMLQRYRDPIPDSPRGRAMVTEGELDDAVRRAESLGLHLAVHAIGDAAVRMVLDSFERAGTPREPGNRHRVEHAEIVDEADVERFAQLGVVCSVQPCHLLADVEVLRSQLPHRLDRVLPLRDLIDSGCGPGGDGGLLWFGSDVPIVRPDPSDSVQAAVHRRRTGDLPGSAIAPGQAITSDEAITAFDARPANNRR